MFVGTPGVRPANIVAAGSGDFINAGVAGEDDFGAGPAGAVGSLFIFAEAGFGEGLVDVGEFVVAEEQSCEDDGQLASAAMAAKAGPPGMPGADDAAEINSDLDEVIEQRLFLLRE